MITDIVFDMVGVVMRFDTKTYYFEHGISEKDAALLGREVFGSLEWARLDRGSIPEDEALQAICSRVPGHLHFAVRDFICRRNRKILPVDGMEELLADLSGKGYRLWLLSNTSKRQHEFWKDVPGRQYFLDTLISADVGLVKPQPEIFMLACSRFHLQPSQTAYIDDTPANAEAAFHVGMHAFVFHDNMAQLRKWLSGLGVL